MRVVSLLLLLPACSFILFAHGGRTSGILCGPESLETETHSCHIAMRTNLLYDAALVPNLGLELSFLNRWSLNLNWAYAWWSLDSAHWYWRIYGGDLDFRYWLGKRTSERILEGHHIGIYGQMFTYDFEAGGKGYMGKPWSYAAGISYGYSLPISEHLNLDFSLGLGYMGGIYEEYMPVDDCYVWQVTKNRIWIGPTKCEVALVWIMW